MFCHEPKAIRIAQQFERGFLAVGSARRPYDDADLHRTIEAYKFFCGKIATEGVIQQRRDAGAKVNEVGILMPPRRSISSAAPTPIQLNIYQ